MQNDPTPSSGKQRIQSPASAPISILRDLRSRAEFEALKQEAPALLELETERRIAEHARQNGVECAFLGYVDPLRVEIIGEEMREHLNADGFNSRQRAVMDEIFHFETENGHSRWTIKIHGHEAISELALRLRGRYPKYFGTEYCSNEQQKRDLFPVSHADVCNLEFDDESFDLIVSCDVLEHVPSLDQALREAHRILKPGGRMIVTAPFFHERDQGLRFATLGAAGIIYHTDPIYHGNPMDAGGGALVFEIPGWDLLARGLASGFADVCVRLICDQRRGVCASHNDAETTLKAVLLFLFDKGRGASTTESRIDDLYRSLLKRPADADGLAHWSAVAEAEGLDAVRDGLMVSDEYRIRNG